MFCQTQKLNCLFKNLNIWRFFPSANFLAAKNSYNKLLTLSWGISDKFCQSRPSEMVLKVRGPTITGDRNFVEWSCALLVTTTGLEKFLEIFRSFTFKRKCILPKSWGYGTPLPPTNPPPPPPSPTHTPSHPALQSTLAKN